jgi:hypothetical protein
LWQKRLEPSQSGIGSFDDHDGYVEACHILLVAQSLIYRKQDIESAGGVP